MTTVFPSKHGEPWPRVAPAEAGFDPARLEAAVGFASEHEIPWSRDLRKQLLSGHFERPPDNDIIGPLKDRGPPNGLVLRGGRLVASWGDTRQLDYTFSAAKSYLSLCAGLAFDDGLIRDLDEPVGRTVHDGGFEGPHNGAVTWRHLLTLSSEWEGTLFGKSEMIDRNRSVATEGRNAQKGQARPLKAPGTYWEYNDVRVNRLSLAVLRRHGRALPEVFAERIMGPIGASRDWTWRGYTTSMVEVNGRMVESVSGGTHWGGGVCIDAEDQARIGLLMLNDGIWHGRRLISERWIDLSLTPCPLNPVYGFLWWLNTDKARTPHAPASSFFASGAGGNLTWIDPDHDIVAVMRWLDPAVHSEFIGRVLAALR